MKRKILWVVNIPLPETGPLFNIPTNPYGGWLIELAKMISNDAKTELHIAFPYYDKKSASKEGETIQYHLVGMLRGTLQYRRAKAWRGLLESEKPDLVNVFGTEYDHALTIVQLCVELNIKSVITLQGLPSFIAKHTRNGLPFSAYYGSSLRDILMGDSIVMTQKKFVKAGKREQTAITLARNVIGRTEWDRACVEIMNPTGKYYSCPETLRSSFLQGEWSLDCIERESIFVSQGQYPLKGLHHALAAVHQLKERFPNVKLYIAGKNIVRRKNPREWILNKHYYSYIRTLIRKYQIQDRVIFTGPLDELQMKERYLKSHLFLSASSIENSPNSIAEALQLAVPTLSSFVGGVSMMIRHRQNGLIYQSDAPYMIPSYIAEVFSDDTFARSLSANARRESQQGLDSEMIVKIMLGIYHDILNEKENEG